MAPPLHTHSRKHAFTLGARVSVLCQARMHGQRALPQWRPRALPACTASVHCQAHVLCDL
eukprot:3512392-Prymnesium_polylepis.1